MLPVILVGVAALVLNVKLSALNCVASGLAAITTLLKLLSFQALPILFAVKTTAVPLAVGVKFSLADTWTLPPNT